MKKYIRLDLVILWSKKVFEVHFFYLSFCIYCSFNEISVTEAQLQSKINQEEL